MLQRLNEFEIYVGGKSDDPNAELTLNLIREFQQGLEQNEEELGKPQEVGSILPGPIWPDPRKRGSMNWFRKLRQFQQWLRSRGDDDNTTLVLRWIAEFELKKIEEWVKANVQGFLGDPPDTDFLRGFLSALLLMEEEALGLPPETPPFAEARELKSARAVPRGVPLTLNLQRL